MIDLYTYGTFNGRRASIMLEETGLNYTVHKIDLMKGEHKQPEYLKIDPSGRIPAIVDHLDDEPIILTQSGAILLYLAEKSGRLLADDPIIRAHALEWLFFHATDIAPNLFNELYFNRLIKPAQPEAAKALQERTFGLYRFFDQRLEENEYLAGPEYSVADVAMLPAVAFIKDDEFNKYSHIQRWIKQLLARPAVQRGLEIPG